MTTKQALRYAIAYLSKAAADGLLEDCVMPLSVVLPQLQAVLDSEQED
uniref:Uncharacterized protein n=1 Tax=viral metagenome TaxID=1070528 RepID=A0A6M3LPP5_9ZZZZ